MGVQVLLAPIPCIHLQSAKNAGLTRRVAFGTSKSGFSDTPTGLTVFIYASPRPPHHHLFRPGVFSWTGKIGAIVKAVERGPRSGMHPDPSVRPPSAEKEDGAFIEFWEVLDLTELQECRPFGDFRGGRPFNGRAPEWPVIAEQI
jgi:hypothetical protein